MAKKKGTANGRDESMAMARMSKADRLKIQKKETAAKKKAAKSDDK